MTPGLPTPAPPDQTAGHPRPAAARPRPAPRRAWQPKPYDPGTVVAYTDTAGTPRTGQVWSAGPVASSVWLLPTHDPTRPAAAKVHRPAHADPSARQLPEYTPEWSRDTVRRCDAVRAAGRVFRCTQTRPAGRWHPDGGRHAAAGPVRAGPYHVEGCPTAGPDREYLTGGSYTRPYGPVAWVVDTLLHSAAGGPLPDFCRTCIYLAEEG